jgi:hypothetical protein
MKTKRWIAMLVAALAMQQAAGSVLVEWTSQESSAAAAWLSGMDRARSESEAGSFVVVTTEDAASASLPFNAMLAIWPDFLGGAYAEVDLFGIGRPPRELVFYSNHPELGGIFPLSWRDFVIESEGGLRTYRYSKAMPLDGGLAHRLVESAASGGLEVRAIFTVDSEEVMGSYPMRFAAIPEPAWAGLLFLASVVGLIQRRRTRV